jgi:hypothetical protein
MLAAMGDNTNSLSLALDARTAVKALNAWRKGGEAHQELKVAMKDAVTSLRALNSGTALFENLSPSSSFESYEQIQTLQEVQSAFPNDDVADKLALAMNEGIDATQHQQYVAFAIAFFSALEKRALQKFNQSYGIGT